MIQLPGERSLTIKRFVVSSVKRLIYQNGAPFDTLLR